MNDKERAAIQQALEALEQYHYTLISAGVLDKQHVLNQGFTAHVALREALEQPVSQEPVAEYLGYTAKSGDVFRLDKEIPVGTKLYTAPQPVSQDPVAWMHKCGDVCSAYDKEHMFGLGYFNIPLYAAPVRTKDLTDDEIYELAKSSEGKSRQWLVWAVIDKLKEKNK